MLGKRKIIALCISRVQDESSYKLVNELNKKIIAQGDNLFVFHTCTALKYDEPIVKGEKTIFEILPYDILDVVILYHEKIKDYVLEKQIAEECHKRNIKTIIIGGKLSGCIEIAYDYVKGFEHVVRHVMEIHRPRTIHFFNGFANEPYSDARREVLKKVLQEYDMTLEDSMISYGEFWERPTIKAMDIFMDSHTLPDAIICANDAMAITVMKYLKKRGYRVPQDVIISGFDGITEAELIAPSITTSHHRQEELTSILMNIIYQKHADQFVSMKYYIEPKIKIGQSCGCQVKHVELDHESIYNMSVLMPNHLAMEQLLARIISKSQVADSLEDVAGEWYDPAFRSMFCVIRKDCLNERIDPFDEVKRNKFHDNWYVLFDNGKDKAAFRPTDTTMENILVRIEELCGTRQPLIFTAINFLDIPLGFTCHFFNDRGVATYYQIPQIVGALGNAIGGYRNIKYQQYLRKHIENMYKYDALTGLYNRAGFMHEYGKVKNSADQTQKFTYVMADLDRLKYINDGFGHEEGDFALRMIADALKYACNEKAIFSRYGGDEMLAVVTVTCEMREIRERFQQYIRDCNEVSVKPYEVSASLGIYQTLDYRERDISEIIKEVDILMYRDKISKKFVG